MGVWWISSLAAIRLASAGGEGRVERGRGMGVELVHNQDDPLGVGVVHVDQAPDAARPVKPRRPVARRHVPPAAQGLGHQEDVGDAAPDVFGVLAGGPSRPRRQGRPGFAQQLTARLVEADDGVRWVEGAGVDRQDIFHGPDERGIGRGSQAPRLAHMRLEDGFFNVWRTVSCEILSTTSSRTNSSASNRRLQRA